jgi:uncharacterized protein (TIGR03663 family)
MKLLRSIPICIALILLAGALRLPRLAQRPMHCDEAVNADKFGTLLEEGRFEYDPAEFHGPTLYYLTLLPAKIQGASHYTEINEVTLRVIPAISGVVLVGAHILVGPVLGVGGAIMAALLAAVSPAMVFYSRYYIHETLLVLFSFGALISACRYVLNPCAAWAVLLGIFFGLMQATKETAIIAFASFGLAFILSLLPEKWRGRATALEWNLRPAHLLMAVLAAAFVSILLFTSFLSNFKGIGNSMRAYGIYLERGNSPSWHVHPWYYYLGILIYSHGDRGPVWTEGIILILAVPGFAAGWSRKTISAVNQRLLRFLGCYTLLMLIIYSAIPYKTPWCLLGFLHGMILLAGAGTRVLWSTVKKTKVGLLAFIMVAAAIGHLGWQAWAASFRFAADPGNPYVYAHTGMDVFLIARRVEELAKAHPQGTAMPIQIISRENLWPLPWYLRKLSGIQWWNAVSDEASTAPVILATPDMEPALIRKLYELPPPGERELYMNIFERGVDLRPQVELRGYAAKSLWDDYSRREANRSVIK